MNSKSKNEQSWNAIFEDYKILEHIDSNNYFIIQSSEINKYREARLMTKFDFEKQLPKIFSKNNLSILPITRGSYIIANFKIFEPLNNNKNLSSIAADNLPNQITAIDIDNISSETSALLCANICGILKHFFEEDRLYHVIGGRMGSGKFDFEISNVNVSVINAQIEIDGGFESEKAIYLVEVKNIIHDDFLIRQIYYPFRTWKERLAVKNVDKQVRNIFLTYSDGVFYLREYIFKNTNDPNSIRLKKESKYSFVTNSLNILELDKLVTNITKVEEPEIPFPQSDDLDKVINICEVLYQSDNEKDYMTNDCISTKFGFVGRQANYYGSSAKYLGLVSYRDKKYKLTETGMRVFSLPLKQRQYELTKLILAHEPFNIIMKAYLSQGRKPIKQEAMDLLIDCKMHGIGKETSTFPRRCSTITSWIDWILDRVEE